MEATLTLVTFKIGMVLFIVGLVFITFPPTKINSIYGYRTTNSRRNLDTWKVANKYSAELMMFEGLIIAAIGLVFSSFIIVVVATEKHLNKLFDKEGNRKT
jgi:uncharacterized membrane protein